MCDGGATTQRAHLLCRTLLCPAENAYLATEPPLTVVLSPCSALMDRSSLSHFEEAYEDSCDRQLDSSQNISDRRCGVKGRPPFTCTRPVPAYPSTATGKRDVSSAATRVRASLTNGTSVASSSPSQLRPGLLNACSHSRGALQERPASFPHNPTFTKFTSAQHPIAAVAAPPPIQAAGARQSQRVQALTSPVAGPASPFTSDVAVTTPQRQPNRKNSDATDVQSDRPRFGASATGSSATVPPAASKRLARRTVKATTARYGAPTLQMRGDSYATLQSPRDRGVEADFNDAEEGGKWSCVHIGPRDHTQERMGVAKASSPRRQQQQPADTALQLPAKGSRSAANAARSSPQHVPRDESTSGKARQDIGARNRANTSKHVKEANHPRLSMGTFPAHVNAASDAHDCRGGADGRIDIACNHTSVEPVLTQEDSSAGGGGACTALPPQKGASLVPVDGDATGPAAMAEDDDVRGTDANVFVAVRVRPRTSLLIENGALPTSLTDVAEHKPQRELRDNGSGSQVEALRLTSDSTVGGGAAMCGRRSASRRAMIRAAKDSTGHDDDDGYASKESCVSADPTNGFIDCSVAVGASTSAANIDAAEQRVRTFRFHFDHVFDDRVTQAEVTACVGQRVVAQVLRGYHGTVLCYGQTGSGKTFTMAGPQGGRLSRKTLQRLASPSAPAEAVEHVAANAGLLPRMLLLLFNGLQARHGAGATAAISSEDVDGGSGSSSRQQQVSVAPVSSWRVMLSATELYNDDLRDLLPGDVPERRGAKPDKEDVPHPFTTAYRHHHLDSGNIGGRRHPRATSTAAPSLHEDDKMVLGSPLSRSHQQLVLCTLPGEPTGDDSPDVVGAASSSEDSDHDDGPSALRTTANGLIGDSATASSVRRGRGQSSISPSPSAAPLRARASQRGNSATARNPTAAASETRMTPNARVGTAIESSKRTPARRAAPTTAPAAVPLQIRQGAPASSASPSAPLTKLMTARTAPPPPSSRASSRQPTCSACSEPVCIEGLREYQVHSLHDAMEVVRLALKQRQTSSTKRNQDSSRSHAFFFVRVEQRRRRSHDRENPVWDIRRSTLMLVDLAGSERVSHTGAHGLQLKEAQNINLSLSALGNVMRLLSLAARASLSKGLAAPSPSGAAARKGATADSHIPYRDSKLTRILQNSLGGNAITFLVCNVSPDPRDAPETMSTLRFAKLCKSVKNNAKVNEATAHVRAAERRAVPATVAKAEARIRRLVGNASALQNRLWQLATYTWWLEGHLGYFAAEIIRQHQHQQRRSSTLTTNTVMGAVISPPHPHRSGSDGSRVIHEETTGPKVISGDICAGAAVGGNQSCSHLAPLIHRERGAEEVRAAPDAALAGLKLPEWWHLSPRPSSPTAQADDADGGDRVAEVQACWHSTEARSLLSPDYRITQRRMELERKLLAAAAAADALHRRSAMSTAATSISSRGSSLPVSGASPTNISGGVSSAPKEVRAPMRNPRRSQAEHEPALQARLAAVEQSNVLLRMRLAELQRLLRQQGGSGHVAGDHHGKNIEHARRRIVAKDASGALFKLTPAASASSASPPESPPALAVANASLVPWPPHYSRVSHDASLEVFLARYGFAAMGPTSPKRPS
ncbi:hypothetical protein GH5_07989 [Leishmania sp. Ghana 2012 LV757]|uniref:hypothetical protein n=1 Tax=Leishmania sp. Ghana 2012 LV757 TaxID=2803181 RepID=UPI001B41096F|nr:hypothetical protein GH5_07989 [Leishmania sp. Ghana 2012 LV757]